MWYSRGPCPRKPHTELLPLLSGFLQWRLRTAAFPKDPLNPGLDPAYPRVLLSRLRLQVPSGLPVARARHSETVLSRATAHWHSAFPKQSRPASPTPDGKLAFLDRGTLLFFHSGSTPRVFSPDWTSVKFALDFKFAAWDPVPRLQRPTAAGHSRPARSVHLPSCVRRPIGGMMDRMVPWVSGQGCQRSVGTWVTVNYGCQC